ncbi:MAG: phospho-sugar mutase [Actinomycetales bacterium]
MTDVAPDVIDLARAWMADDPDPVTQAELQRLVEQAESGGAAANQALAELSDRFRGRLEFGTAGLRGALGAGPNRMNRSVVISAAAGLMTYLKQHGGEAIVVGYDARHNSDVFAEDTCAVAAAAGIRAMVLPRPLPTPVLAFAVRYLGVDAGVMVTASHNPPQDNGYKVYLGTGAQIVPPADTEISAAIDEVGPVLGVPRADEGWQTLDDEVLNAYLERTIASVRQPELIRDLRIVYTPMHGVGGEVVAEAFRRVGAQHFSVVPRQAEPDPDFPTVSFPNPEEPGALDLAFAAAREDNAQLIIANDPDADRAAVAVPDPQADAGWRMLRGDEVGILLGDYLARRGVPEGGIFANSIVSSSMLARIAAKHGIPHQETLTGFKWLGRIDGLAFGYEEALGYDVDPSVVKDKDGVSAALVIAELVGSLQAEGISVLERLDQLMAEYGLHVTDQLSIRVSDLSQIGTAMARLRDEPPATLGGRDIEEVEDLSQGVNGLPPTDGLRYRLAGGARVIVRPSGTEPKLKAYLEVVDDVPNGDVPAARQRAREVLEAMRTDLSEALGL